MRGSDEVHATLERVIRGSSADLTEVIYRGTDTRLTRFANNYVHQNVSERNALVYVRTVVDGRIGRATTNDFSAESIKRTVQTATNVGLAQAENPDFPGLAPKLPAPQVDVYDDEAAHMTPAQRAQGAGTVCRCAEAAGLVAAGAYSSAATEMGLMNSNGVELYHARTELELSTVMQGTTGSGYAAKLGTRLADIDDAAVADEVRQRTQLAQNPRDVEVGAYEVVLETYATHDIANFMSMVAFGARAVQEGRSFMAGKFGQSVMSPSVSFWDDGADPTGFAATFDYEGTPKQKVELVTNGIATGVVYDRWTARKEARESTGHALPPESGTGPLPLNLFMGAGDKSRDELIAGVERGILVTRFWYTRTVHPLPVVVTGMTRDGTFLIENGAIKAPIKNLRFTTSYLEALNDVRNIGSETALNRGYFGITRVPALHLGKFNFTGATDF